MLRIYTCLSTLIFLVCLPFIVICSLLKKKYRGRFLQKTGFFYPDLPVKHSDPDRAVIWIHALSVGEVTSALPLIKGLRHKFPGSIICFSTATETGMKTAKQQAAALVDIIFYSPFDVYFAVHLSIKKIKPSVFILIETDFWPCWLHSLQKHSIPCLLANGRCSQKSFAAYQRFAFLFRPMFNCFNFLAMQSAGDADSIKLLGIAEKKILCPGNLKFDAAMKDNSSTSKLSRAELGLPSDRPLLVCGSTHHGEEEIIIKAYRQLLHKHPELILMIAPRDINRTKTIVNLADKHNFKAVRRSQSEQVEIKDQLLGSTRKSFTNNGSCSKNKVLLAEDTIYILDTLGELFSCYRLATIAFIGGSMVSAGGHNPIEAASASLPVLFGTHMEDFAEISSNLVENGGAVIVCNGKELTEQVSLMLENKSRAERMGKAAGKQVILQQGVVKKHLDTISGLLTYPGNPIPQADE